MIGANDSTDSVTSELLAARLTPQGRGAVATVGVSGDLSRINSCFQAANGRTISDQDLNRISFGHWGNDHTEEVVIVRIAEDLLELHCHGGMAAVDRIVRDLHACGCRIVSQSDWAQVAFGAIDAEGAEILQRTTTRLAAHHALRQMSLFPEAIQALQQLAPSDGIAVIDDMLALGEVAKHLLTPWEVVLCGRPNVGKSSLINALVGFERTVVFDQPGTTRDVVTAETAIQGWPILFSDTAGLRETDSELEAAGIARARHRLTTADLIIVVLDATAGIVPEDEEILRAFPNAIRVWNKCDLALAETGSAPEAAIPVSALTSAGIPHLVERIIQQLVPVKLPTDRAFPISEKQFRFLRHQRDLLTQIR